MFYKKFLNDFCLGLGSSQEEVDSFIDSFAVLDMRNLSEERKNRLWMPKSSYHVDLGRPEISIGLNLDEDKNIILANVMTDFQYQSKDGDSDYHFYLWVHPDYKEFLNIDKDIVYSKKYKQNIHGLFYVSDLDDLLKIALLINNNEDIPYLDTVSTSVEMASRFMVRRYQKILEKSTFTKDLGIKEMTREHLLWMCEKILWNRYPVDKMNRWLGYIQAAMIMQGVVNVEDERNYSRPIFHMAYRTEGVSIPVSSDPISSDLK